MLGSRTAASADKRGTHPARLRHKRGKGLGSEVVDGLAVNHLRQSCVGVKNDRSRRALKQAGEKLKHILGSHRAVHSYSVGAESL